MPVWVAAGPFWSLLQELTVSGSCRQVRPHVTQENLLRLGLPLQWRQLWPQAHPALMLPSAQPGFLCTIPDRHSSDKVLAVVVAKNLGSWLRTWFLSLSFLLCELGRGP